MELYQPTGQNNNDTTANFTGSALVDFGDSLGPATTAGGGGGAGTGTGTGTATASVSDVFTFRF